MFIFGFKNVKMALEEACAKHAAVLEDTIELATLLDLAVHNLKEADKNLEGDYNRTDQVMQTYQTAYAKWKQAHAVWYAATMPTLIEVNQLKNN